MELMATAVAHTHIKRILHPRLGVEVDGRTIGGTGHAGPESRGLAPDLKKGMTATAAVPTRREMHSGDVQMPALLNTPARA